MKRILITGAGGTPSTNFVRSLRASLEEFYFIGVDVDKYYLQRSETDEKYLIPKASDPRFIPYLKKIIFETKPDLLYMQPDQEISIISKYRDELGVKVFLPHDNTIQLCQDKYLSAKKWEEAGIKVPKTILVNDEDDLRAAFSTFGSPVWVRAIISPGGGVGSFKAQNLKAAIAWIDFCEGWGNFIAAECLEAQSVTWQSIWSDGNLIVAQGRKRLYWEFASRAPSGVTGITGTGVTVSDPSIDDIAQKVILAIDKNPNGIFSVDLTYDKLGVPNPTEINIGRFFTTHEFFTRAGLNMPYIFTKIAFNEALPYIPRRINPLTNDLVWIRGMDFLPVLTNMSQIDASEKDYLNRLTGL